jgi:hypothetical protein
VDPSVAPGTTWEVRLRWGSRRLAAELLGVERTTLKLGNQPDDDVDTGSAARLQFRLTGRGLEVEFSTGVAGTASVRGDVATPLGQLVQRGEAVEARPETWRLLLHDGDEAKLVVGGLVVDVRRARGRIRRLGFDLRVLVLIALALLGVGVVVTSVAAPTPPPRLPVKRAPKR